jgi:tetratricopeptide (TPR) repeat protein
MIKSLLFGINMQEDENAKAEALYVQGNYDEAVSAWERAERAGPPSFDLWYK